LAKFVTSPVGTDESLFNLSVKRTRKDDKRFELIYYGSMLPLHGLNYLLDAAVELAKTKPEVHFTFLGGKQATKDLVDQAIAKGANVTYIQWVPFETLPQMVADSDLAIGGPFGKTLQSQFVVTGKVYQYLALGVPALIGSNKASAIFTDKKDCLLVPEANTKALVETITWATEHRQQLVTIGHEGRKTYDQHFSQRVIVNKLQQLINNL
jgi:glycosyltransferase involved in cell wall biosynthesis